MSRKNKSYSNNNNQNKGNQNQQQSQANTPVENTQQAVNESNTFVTPDPVVPSENVSTENVQGNDGNMENLAQQQAIVKEDTEQLVTDARVKLDYMQQNLMGIAGTPAPEEDELEEAAKEAKAVAEEEMSKMTFDPNDPKAIEAEKELEQEIESIISGEEERPDDAEAGEQVNDDIEPVVEEFEDETEVSIEVSTSVAGIDEPFMIEVTTNPDIIDRLELRAKKTGLDYVIAADKKSINFYGFKTQQDAVKANRLIQTKGLRGTIKSNN